MKERLNDFLDPHKGFLWKRQVRRPSARFSDVYRTFWGVQSSYGTSPIHLVACRLAYIRSLSPLVDELSELSNICDGTSDASLLRTLHLAQRRSAAVLDETTWMPQS